MEVRYTSQQKKDLVEAIHGLDKNQQEDMFFIFQRHGVKFSRNINGIFINLKDVKAACLMEIDQYMVSLKERNDRIERLKDDIHSLADVSPLYPSSGATSIPLFSSSATEDTVADSQPASSMTVPFQDVHQKEQFQEFTSCMQNPTTKKTQTQNKFFLLKKKYSKPFQSAESKKQDDFNYAYGLAKEAFVCGV